MPNASGFDGKLLPIDHMYRGAFEEDHQLVESVRVLRELGLRIADINLKRQRRIREKIALLKSAA